VAALAEIDLEADITIPISQFARCGGACVRVWSDERYSEITFSSPDILEESLMNLVHEGKARPALMWYKKNRQHSKKTTLMETIKRFPERYMRHRST
jgi:hypothetical protein